MWVNHEQTRLADNSEMQAQEQWVNALQKQLQDSEDGAASLSSKLNAAQASVQVTSPALFRGSHMACMVT